MVGWYPHPSSKIVVKSHFIPFFPDCYQSGQLGTHLHPRGRRRGRSGEPENKIQVSKEWLGWLETFGIGSKLNENCELEKMF